MRNAAHAAPANVASQVLGVLPLSAAAASDTSLTRGSPEVHESTSDHPVAATRPATTAQISRHRKELKKISPDVSWGFMTFFMLFPPRNDLHLADDDGAIGVRWTTTTGALCDRQGRGAGIGGAVADSRRGVMVAKPPHGQRESIVKNAAESTS